MKVFNIDDIKIGVDTYSAQEMTLAVREREKKAVVRVFNELTGLNINSFSHYSDGAPYVDGEELQVSISHCRSHVAVAVGGRNSVFGIDIEQMRDQIERVKTKFLSADGLCIWDSNPLSLLRAWTLMEAAYKAARIQGLDIKNEIAMWPLQGCQPDQEYLEGICAVKENKKYRFTSILLQPKLVVSVVNA